jgi:hypothetical protein
MTNPHEENNFANLVEHTRDGGGKKTPQDRQLKEVTILDRYNNAAS